MGEQSAIVAVPRRYEALAFIMERIVSNGISPSFEEIGIELCVSKTRARQLVDELVDENLIVRPVGRMRSFRVKDVAGSRNILVQALNRLGWVDAVPLGNLLQPCSIEQLPMMPPFEHLHNLE